MVYLERSLVVSWLMPRETAVVSAHVLCTPYKRSPCHFMQSHARKVPVCLAVTYHLHFWQNDRDLLRATAVTRGWNGYRNESQHKKWTQEKKFSHCSCRDSNPRPFNHESGALTTELSPLPGKKSGNVHLVGADRSSSEGQIRNEVNPFTAKHARTP